MEAFRRFRSRKKSRGQADGFTTFADAEVSYRIASSAWQPSTSQSSATVSRPSDVSTSKIGHDQIGQPKSPIESRPPASADRIQPMRIGISRLSTARSRPGTAGSMQKALDQAADSVAQTSQQPQVTASPASQLGLKPGKYIDILAIASQPSKNTRPFNEHVAERNIDHVTLTDEEQQYRYEPTSMYQEEVAARNAHQITAKRGSSLRRNFENGPVQAGDSRATTAHSGSYSHHSSAGVDAARSTPTQTNTAYHSRQNMSRTRDGSNHLPAIPQEQSSEDFTITEQKRLSLVQETEDQPDQAKARWGDVRRQSRAGPSLDVDKPLPASPRQNDKLRDSGVSSVRSYVPTDQNPPDASQARIPGQAYVYASSHSAERNTLYRALSPAASETPPRQSIQTVQSQRTNHSSESSRRLDRQRPPSETSNPTFRKAFVGNRTIMDLTGEDDEDVVSLEPITGTCSVASYQQSPVIEHARAVAPQKVMPTVVDHSPTYPPPQIRERDSVVPNFRWSSAQEPVLDLDQLVRQSQAMSETATAAVKAKMETVAQEAPRAQTPPASLAFSPIQTLTSSTPPRTITFSAINTLTSTSPRSSHEMLVKAEDLSPEASDENTAPNKVSSDSLSAPATQSNSRSNARISANISPLVKIFADVSPDEFEAACLPSSSKPRSVREGKEGERASDKSSSTKKDGKKRERSAEEQAIRAVAKSKIPAGPLDQELLTGVKTRDFAIVPLEKPTNKRVEALAERKRAPVGPKKTSRERSSSSKSSSSNEHKSRSRSSKSAAKAASTDNAVSSSTSVAKTSGKETEKRSGSKKSGKQDARATRKSRRQAIFDEEAFKKKHAEANAALLRLQQSLQEPLEEEERPGSATPRGTATPASPVLAPSSNMPAQNSPSAAALAMITAATTTPRARAQAQAQAIKAALHTKTSSDLGRQAQPSKLSVVDRSATENDVPPMKTTTLTPFNPMLARIDLSNKPPPSPGEVSLSSFPIPTSRAISPETTRSPPAYVKDVGMPTRSGSQASRVSSASTFSIPFTMVPSRLASLPENRMGIPGPSTAPHMDSIASVIPPTKTEVVSP